MNGREPWNEGKPAILWTPTEGQRYTPAGGAGDSLVCDGHGRSDSHLDVLLS